MYDIKNFRALIHEARLHGYLTQRDLADRIGTSQSAIAKLEQGQANPTVETLARCAEAAGFTIQISLMPIAPTDPIVELYKHDVDRTLLRENLRKSVDERLRTLGEWQRDVVAFQSAMASSRAKRVADAPTKAPHKHPPSA